jgi:hypothetical protein
MPNRESLHALIDTLPEAALESAERVLQNYQIWPPKPPIDVEKMRKRWTNFLAGAAKNWLLVRGQDLQVPVPAAGVLKRTETVWPR